MTTLFKNKKGLEGVEAIIAIAVMLLGTYGAMPMQPMVQPAYAVGTYNISSQGIEVNNTTSSWTNAYHEVDLTGIDLKSEMLAQNNRYIVNPGFGSGGWVWSQAIIGVEEDNTSFQTYQCTDKTGASMNCKVPNQLKIWGHYELFTGRSGCDSNPDPDWTMRPM